MTALRLLGCLCVAEIVKIQRELKVAQAPLAGASEAQAEASVLKVTSHVLDVSSDAVSDRRSALR